MSYVGTSGPVLFFTPASAVAYYYDTSEHHEGGKDFLPGQGVHSYADADYDGYYRLNITVHAHKGRSDTFLSERDEKICYECGTDDQVCQFCYLYLRDC